jgi:hypothetical protein
VTMTRKKMSMTAGTYGDIITKELHATGWSYGHVSAVESGMPVCIADASKNGQEVLCQG